MTGRIVRSLVLLVLIGLVTLIAALFWLSPGKPVPLRGPAGQELPYSITEKLETNINGVNQGMIIRGADQRNPVLLFLHDGPALPLYCFSEEYPTGLENYVTLCWWEQRGVGLSYTYDMLEESITAERLIADTLEVTRYLLKRFGQDRIFLLGHGWGSYIGIQAAKRAPQLYHAYIGMAQIAYQDESERLSYQYMTHHYRESGNARMLKRLMAYPVLESETARYAFFRSPLREEVLHSLGLGTMHHIGSPFLGLLFPMLRCRAYTLGEKLAFWRSRAFIQRASGLWESVFSGDLRSQIKELEIPVYFFSGIYDYMVSHTLSEDFLHHIKAPCKAFYSFPHSAHTPLIEEPEQFLTIMIRDVLNAGSGKPMP